MVAELAIKLYHILNTYSDCHNYLPLKRYVKKEKKNPQGTYCKKYKLYFDDNDTTYNMKRKENI